MSLAALTEWQQQNRGYKTHQLTECWPCDAVAADQGCGIAAAAVCASVAKPEVSNTADELSEGNTGKGAKDNQKAVKGRTQRGPTAEVNVASEASGRSPAASQRQESSNDNRKAARQSARGGPAAERSLKGPGSVEKAALTREQQGSVPGRGKGLKAACLQDKENQMLEADS